MQDTCLPRKRQFNSAAKNSTKAGPNSAVLPRVLATVKLGAKTDLGRIRENNEDKFDFYEPEDPAVLATKGGFYGVADGMGGHSAGQIACELALKSSFAPTTPTRRPTRTPACAAPSRKRTH